MKTMTFTGRGGLSLVLCLASLLSIAAPKAQADEEKDPPTRVARISYVDGSVSLQPGGEGDWGSAARNRPVTIGDKLWVDKDSRAELQAGTASIHLGSMTALSFLNLDQGITQLRLAEGSINFRVSELREGDLYEVDAPNLAFTVKQAGAFRIDVDETGDSARVTVIRGEGEVAAGGKTYEVHSGERAEFTGTDNVDYVMDKAPGPDGLDRWAADRDLKEDNSISGKYVSRETPGYSDLDDNGTWQDEPEYGHVWYPNDVAPGWAPYSDGYWNYVGPWAGLGLTTLHGVLLPTTMADGTILAEGGAGARARFLVLRSMGRPLSVSLAEALASASAGSRWASANRSFRGSTAATSSLRGSTNAILLSATEMSSTRTFATSIS